MMVARAGVSRAVPWITTEFHRGGLTTSDGKRGCWQQGRLAMRANMFLGMAGAVAGMAIIFGAFVAPVSAATATANLGVSATVTVNCTISTAALAFGSYDPVGTNAAANLD